MTKFSTYNTAKTVQSQLKKIGFDATIDGSNLSASQYVYAIRTLNDEIVAEYKIRISDHELPASYQNCDDCVVFEVGPCRFSMHWAQAVASICKKEGIAHSGHVTTALNKLATEKEAAQVADQSAVARRQKELQRSKMIDQILVEKGKGELTGKSRKRARAKISKELREKGI